MCVMPSGASVYLCLEVTCWERADLLALVCGVYLSLSLSHGILGQVWYLIVSIPDICTLTYLLYREKHETIFLSEITRPRALTFGMNHHQVNC